MSHLYKPAEIIQPDGSSLVQLYPNLELANDSMMVNDILHDAFVSQNGTWYGPLGPGSMLIDTGLPSFLAGLRTIQTGGHIPGINIFFVRKQAVFLPWGTGEILCQEPIMNGLTLPVRILAGGTAQLKVRDSSRFLTHLVGLRSFDDPDLNDLIMPALLVPALRNALARAMIGRSIHNLQSLQSTITEKLLFTLSPALEKMGLKLQSLTINSLSVHPDDLTRLQQISNQRIDDAVALESTKRELDTLYGGNIRNKVAAEAVLAYANNPGLAGSPMSHLAMMPTVLGTAGHFGNQLQGFVEETLGQADLFAPRPRAHTDTLCPNCGQPMNTAFAFCPHCGAPRSG